MDLSAGTAWLKRAGTLRRSLLLPLLFSISLSDAQQPTVPPSVFNFPARQGQADGTSNLPPTSSSRVCTPAEYGDPGADCVPSPNRLGTGQYPDLNGLDGMDQSLDGAYPNLGLSLGSSQDAYGERSRDNNSARPAPSTTRKEPPTEFQRYVAGSIGRMLPIFGASLFERVPATFAPLDHAPVAAGYQIAPGDQLQISIWGQFNLSRRVTVDRNGEISLPEAGPSAVAGLNYSQAAAVIKSSLARLYKNFDVSVSLTRLHSIQIFVVGEARSPGSFTVSSLSTLVNAIFSSGGPSARGSMRVIELRRGDQLIRQFDLYQLLFHGDKSQDCQLLPGDVLFFPAAGPHVAIAGSVGHPAIYELKSQTTVADVLQLADGLSPLASRRRVMLERITDDSSLQTQHLSLKGDDMRLEVHDGDILRLLSIVPKFGNAVTLRGNVADPGRFPWHEGMRLSELIPNRESLLTRDYWNSRNALGAGEELALDDEMELPAATASQGGAALTPARSTTSREITTLRNGGIPAGRFQEQGRNLQGDSSLGAATATGNLPAMRTFNPRYTVQPSVPEINWDYAAIERTDPETLSTVMLSFGLGKLVLQHDAEQDLVLRPGDVVTIFSKADFAVPRTEQPTLVRIEGEVKMAGIYTVQPGESLRQVVARAGGLSPNAYLYGAQFTRESTRREQQKRFDDFLNQLEREMNVSAASLSSQVASPQQAATAQTTLLSQRDLLDRLRKTSVNGRIVFNLNDGANGLTAIPDIPLENGDRLIVPPRPSTINIIGDVFEQASFLYHEDFRTGDYLKLAGGTARSADRSHMFLIRADGSVVSKRDSNSLFAKTFDGLPMYPGDTLVVPTYVNKTTVLRGLVDWSQVFSNLALGAAAVNILH